MRLLNGIVQREMVMTNCRAYFQKEFLFILHYVSWGGDINHIPGSVSFLSNLSNLIDLIMYINIGHPLSSPKSLT